MKLHPYFEFVRWPQRPEIRLEWIEDVIRSPTRTERQSDGRMRYWGYVFAARKYLRVVLLPDGETVFNAFFDRDFRG